MREFDRLQALHTAMDLAAATKKHLTIARYDGPVAVAGGYVRDLAILREPKDADLFLDSGFVRDEAHALEIGAQISDMFGHGASEKVINGYAWTKDVAYIIKIEFPEGQTQKFYWLGNTPVPWAVDLVVLKRDELLKANYIPGNEHSFLQAVISRVDTRINAIGATPLTSLTAGQWAEDAAQHRIVINSERYGEDSKRIDTRVARLTAGKLKGWSVFHDGPNDELRPHLGACT